MVVIRLIITGMPNWTLDLSNNGIVNGAISKLPNRKNAREGIASVSYLITSIHIVLMKNNRRVVSSHT